VDVRDREAALWVVSRWERSASPAVLFAALAPLFRPSFGTRVADRLWWVVFSAGTICFVGLLSAGVMHLYGALVGGAMDRGETGFYRSS
jgi:hypothetical protein